jgi:hypothetical protein
MVELSKITEQNPWWKFGKDFVYYDKNMKEFRRASVKFKRRKIDLISANIYALHGPRQVGKTTEIKNIILGLIEKNDPDSICYFSCEVLVSRRELRKVLDFFLSKLVEHERIYIFLDEINFVKDWVPEIKRIADSARSDRVIIFFTGSPFGIKVHTHELVGRNIEGNRYYMKPLSFRDFALQASKRCVNLTSDPALKRELDILPPNLRESSIELEKPFEEIVSTFRKMLKFRDSLSFLFDIYLKTGGFPAIINDYLQHHKEEERIETGFYERFIELITKDALVQGKNDRIVRQIISGTIKKFGSRYDFRGLTREIEEPISHPTTIDYLRLMEDNFLIQLLYSYDFTKGTIKYRGAKKLYFTDPFIFHAFNSWIYGKPGYSFSEEFLQDETHVSRLIESVVCNHLAKTKEFPIVKPMESFLWFYYDVRKELDFVYKKENGGYLGLEIKYKTKASIKDLSPIDPVKRYLLLSKDEFVVYDDAAIVPIYLFLPLLETSEKNL